MGQEVVDYGATVRDGTGDELHIAFAKLDAGARSFTVIDKDLTAPPGSPSIGDVYIVAGSATGAWETHDGKIAVFGLASTWRFIEAVEGMLAYAQDEDTEYRYNGTTWAETSAGGGGGGGSDLGWINVKTDHGATGDGLRRTGSISASSSTLTITVGSFVSGDVGKLISVRGAGASGVELITTIAGFTNSTTVTLTAAASTTVSGEAVYFGTDDTTAIQAAIDAAETAGGGTIYYPAGIYCVGGALQDTSGANSQLLLPTVEVANTRPVAVSFVGDHPPYKTLSVARTIIAPDGGSIIKGMLNTGSGGLLGGFNSSHPQDFTNVTFFARDITFRMPNNPELSCLALGKTSSIELENVTVDTGRYGQNATEPTKTDGVGIRTPRNNNGAWTILRSVTVAGFRNGVDCYEHTDIDNSQFWYCHSAIRFLAATNYSSRLGRVLVVNCQTPVRVNGAHHFEIEQLAIEHYNTSVNGAKWYEPGNDLEDSLNAGKGRITFHVVTAGTGITNGAFTKNGGTGVLCRSVESLLTASGSQGLDGTSALTVVRVVATTNVDIATGLEDSDTLDGVTLGTGDSVLLAGQTDPEDNGVYVVVASGAASRHPSFTTYDSLPGVYFSIMEGSANSDTLWRCTSDRGGTIDTTALVFSQFFGGSGSGDAPTRTTATLSGSSTDVPIPSGVTWLKFQSKTITLTAGGNGCFVGLRHTGNTVAQTWSGFGNSGSVSAADGFALAVPTATSRWIEGYVYGPRDASKPAVAGGRGFGNAFGSRHVYSDSSEDHDTMRFTCSGGGTFSGTVEIMWFYN